MAVAPAVTVAAPGAEAFQTAEARRWPGLPRSEGEVGRGATGRGATGRRAPVARSGVRLVPLVTGRTADVVRDRERGRHPVRSPTPAGSRRLHRLGLDVGLG